MEWDGFGVSEAEEEGIAGVAVRAAIPPRFSKSKTVALRSWFAVKFSGVGCKREVV